MSPYHGLVIKPASTVTGGGVGTNFFVFGGSYNPIRVTPDKTFRRIPHGCRPLGQQRHTTWGGDADTQKSNYSRLVLGEYSMRSSRHYGVYYGPPLGPE